MTTPSTPAGWYPDPEGAGGLRYWDGFAWTEHRAPAATPAPAPEVPADEFPASEQATSVVSLPEQPTTVVRRQSAPSPTPDPDAAGAHRAPDPEPAASSSDAPPTPSYEPSSWEPPPIPSWEPPPIPSWETPSLETPSSPSREAPPSETPSGPSQEAPPSDATPTPPFGTPAYEAQSYDKRSFEAHAYGAPPTGTLSAFAGLSEPPVASGGPGGPDNRKLIIGFLGAVGALLLILVLVLVYAFVIRDDTTTRSASPGTSTSASRTPTESSETETESEATEAPAPPAGDQATEGDFTFSVASTDSGDTVTSPINEYIEKTANGEFFVVYLNVGNSGSAPLTFLSTLQQLKADADTFPPDDEASFYLGGGVVTVNPGEQVETAIAFDVPVGTTPTSIQVHGEPGGVGVELPV